MGKLNNTFRISFFALLLSLAAFLFLCNVISLINRGGPYISRFLAFNGNATLLRKTSPFVEVAEKAKILIPTGACVETSFHKSAPLLENVAFKYELFPLKVSDDWPNEYNRSAPACNGRFFIDLHGIVKNIPARWTVLARINRATIFEMERPIDDRPPPRSNADHANVWIYLLYIALIFGSGCFILGGTLPHVAEQPLSAKLSSAFLTGLSATTLALWPLVLVKIPITYPLIWTITAAAFILSYIFFKYKGGKLSAMFHFQNPPLSVFAIDLLLVASLCFFLFFTISFPISIWDEMHIWLLKAKMFYYDRSLSFDYTQFNNNYYPVLWPLNLTMQYFFVGGAFDEIAKWTSALLFISTAGQIKFISWQLGLGRRMSSLTVFVFLVFYFHWTFATALAENIYIALTMMACAYVMNWIRDPSRASLCIAALVLSMLSGVKYEGWLVAIFITLAYIFLKERPWSGLLPRAKKLGILLTAPGVYLLWLFWLKTNQIQYDVFHLHGHLSLVNVRTLIEMIIQYYRQETIALVLLLLLAASMAWAWKAEWLLLEKFLLVFLCGLMLFGLSAGLCWPNEEFRLYYPEVLTRLFSRATPFVAILWISRVVRVMNSARRPHGQ